MWRRDIWVWLTKPKLVRAAKKGRLRTVRRLLDEGVPVDIRDRYGRTALMEACREGHVEIVRLLLDYGAEPLRQSGSWKTARGYASKEEIRQMLGPKRG